MVDQLTLELENCRHGVLDKDKKLRVEELISEIEKAWDREEMFWWQRSRVGWLKSGDRNTMFFHSSTVQRRMRNKVTKLKSTTGLWLEKEDEINEALTSFYNGLFASCGNLEMEEVLGFVKCQITDVDNVMLERRVSVDEIKEVVLQLGSLKAPGPDGFSGVFYQKSWSEVSNEVVDMVCDFFLIIILV